MKRALILSCLCLTSLTLGACGSSGSDTPSGGACTTTGTGSLKVTVSGLPSGIDADLSVTGPDGVPHAVTATTTLTALPSGAYTASASTVTDSDPIVRKAFMASAPASVTVCDGQTATLDLGYTLIPTSNQIWWANQNASNDTLAYASSALGAGGTTAPTREVSTEGTLPGAFTPNGDLWVIDRVSGGVGLKRYLASALGASGSATPATMITSDALTASVPGPISFTLDKSGNAWVGVSSEKILKFDASQLLASGDVTPSVEISNVPNPTALAFDGDGNLWVGSDANVLEYVAARLSASTADAPDVSFTAHTGGQVDVPLTSVLGLAATADNALWANYGGTLALVPSPASGDIVPGIQIAVDVAALAEGIALDESGGLWMAFGAGQICKLGASQLTASGAPTPEVVISSTSIGSAGTPALFPAPAGLPLYAALK